MTRVYVVTKSAQCLLLACGCESMQRNPYNTPGHECDDCVAYTDWKKSGLTMEEYREAH